MASVLVFPSVWAESCSDVLWTNSISHRRSEALEWVDSPVNTKKCYGINHGFLIGVQHGFRNHPQYFHFQPLIGGLDLWFEDFTLGVCRGHSRDTPPKNHQTTNPTTS